MKLNQPQRELLAILFDMDVLQEYYDTEFNLNRELPQLSELHPEEKAAIYNSVGYAEFRMSKAVHNVLIQVGKQLQPHLHRFGACNNELCEKCNPSDQ